MLLKAGEMTQPEPARQSKKRLSGIVVLALAIAALLPAAYWMARPFLAAGIVAAILAVALDPAQSHLTRLVRRPSIAALITTSAAVACVLAAVTLTGMAVKREIRSGILASLAGSAGLLDGRFALDFARIREALPELSRAAGVLFTGIFAAVFLYVLLVHGRTWVREIVALLPVEAPVSERILAAVRDAIIANVDGILAMAAVEALAYGAIFRIAGMASPGMWGAFAGLASMIPLIGASVVWLPLSIALAVQGACIKAAVVGGVCLASQEAVAYILLPRVIGARLHHPPLLLALSILGATSAFGAIGILVGPVIISVLGALVHELRLQLRQSQSAAAGAE